MGFILAPIVAIGEAIGGALAGAGAAAGLGAAEAGFGAAAGLGAAEAGFGAAAGLGAAEAGFGAGLGGALGTEAAFGGGLFGAGLGGAELFGAEAALGGWLSGAELFGTGAELFGAEAAFGGGLAGGELFGAGLGGAELFGAGLGGAELFGAEAALGGWLSGAELFGTPVAGDIVSALGGELAGNAYGAFAAAADPASLTWELAFSDLAAPVAGEPVLTTHGWDEAGFIGLGGKPPAQPAPAPGFGGGVPPVPEVATEPYRALGVAPAGRGLGSAFGQFNPGALLSSLLQMAMGKPKMPALGGGNAAAQRLMEQANLLLDRYNQGVLSAPMMAQIQTNLLAQLNRIRQGFASSGRYNSTDRIRAENAAYLAATAAMASALDRELQMGLNALGTAGAQFNDLARLQLQADSAYRASLARSLESVMRIPFAGGTTPFSLPSLAAPEFGASGFGGEVGATTFGEFAA